MGLRDWFYGSGDEEYSSQTGSSHSSYPSYPSYSGDEDGPHFQSSYSSTVTRCEPDESGQTKCRRYVTKRSQKGAGEGWEEERRDEEVPYEEIGGGMPGMPGMGSMMEEMNRMMEDFASAFGGFRVDPRPAGHPRDTEDQGFPFGWGRMPGWEKPEFQRRPRPGPAPYRPPEQTDDIFDA